MSELSARQLNELIVQNLGNPEGLEKVAEANNTYIRTKLRETSFTRKIVPPQYVTKVDLHPSVNHDGLVKIVEIEPDASAMTVNFLGQANAEYIRGERYAIPFFTISSKDYQKNEKELLAYDLPFTDIVEKNSLLEIQRIEDTHIMAQVDAAIAVEVAKGNVTAQTGTYASDGSIKKGDFKKLFDTLDSNELNAEVILMDRTTYNRLFIWDATTVGDALGNELTVNGYTYGTLFGRKLVVSNKVSLLQNKIYVFTAPEYFAQFLILDDTKFFIEKKRNIITFNVYEDIGFGIGNTAAAGVLTFTGTDS